eukprot:scaffold4827_cov109-Isochrysis_galbana.AAC.24
MEHCTIAPQPRGRFVAPLLEAEPALHQRAHGLRTASASKARFWPIHPRRGGVGAEFSPAASVVHCPPRSPSADCARLVPSP